MNEPQRPKAGPKWFRDAIWQLILWQREQRPISGPGIIVSQGSGGRPVKYSGASNGGTEDSTFPFQLLNVSTTSNEGTISEARIRVVYGTLAGAAPPGMSPGDSPPYILTGMTGTGVVYGGITRNPTSGAITSRYIAFAATLPVGDESNGYIEFGSYSLTSSSLTLGQAVSGSQAYQYCNGHNWGLV